MDARKKEVIGTFKGVPVYKNISFSPRGKRRDNEMKTHPQRFTSSHDKASWSFQYKKFDVIITTMRDEIIELKRRVKEIETRRNQRSKVCTL